MNANAKEVGSDGQNKIMGELKAVIKDAEDLLKNAEHQASDGFKSAREKFESTLENAKDELLQLEQTVVDKAKEAAHSTDEYVKDHPWKSVGLGACVGLILGLLIGRK